MNDLPHTAHTQPLPPEAESRVRALLSGTLPAGERRSAMEHLRLCGACRDLYDGIAETERALAAAPGAVLGNPALERVAERLAQDLPPARRQPVWLRWAAAAVAASVAVVVIGRLASTPDEEFTPRGSGTHAEQTGIRVFRLSDAGAAELRDGDVVRPGESLGASYTSGSYESVRWYVERDGGAREPLSELAGAIRAGVVDEPLADAVPVDGRFGRGEVRVVAVFSGSAGEVRHERKLRVEEVAR